MRKIHQKATAMFLVMLMVLGGMTGLLTPGGGKAYAISSPTIYDEDIIDVVTSSDHKTVTLTVGKYMARSSGVSVTEAVYVARTGPDNFISLATDSPVNATTVVPDEDAGQTVFTLTFETPLTGNNNAVQIQGQYFENYSEVPYSGTATTSQLDLQPPEYVGAYLYNSGRDMYLYFNEALTINSDMDSNEFLRGKISIATDGVNFEPLSESLHVNFNYYWSNTIIQLNANNGRKIVYGANTRIKIASGTFKDDEGNLNDEMNLDITAPVIQSAVLSNDNHDVTITFNEAVIENTANCECNLIDQISLLKNSERTYLDEENGDTVAIDEDGKLVIHFNQALSGANNQISINGGPITDAWGNADYNNELLTPMLHGGTTDTTAPELINYYLSSDKKVLTFVFDEDVVSNLDEEEDFISAIEYVYIDYDCDCWMEGLPGTEDSAVISGNTVTLQLGQALNNWTEFQIIESSLKDTAGNVQEDYISTGRINANGSLDFYDYISSFSNNGRWLNLDFGSDIRDNTIVDGVSDLRKKIEVSTDGVNYSTLTADDVVAIQGDKLVVLFHEAKKSGTVHVKVKTDALSDSHVYSQTNLEIDTVFVYNTPELKGYFFTNTVSELTFEDNSEWRSKVKDIIVYSNNYESCSSTTRRLLSSEYTLTEGKLTINQGVFQEGYYYEIYIDADGYSRKDIDGDAFNSSELFYVTAPVITKQGGIQAKINILRNDVETLYGSTQTVIFELFNGTTPVSIVASELDVYTGSYSAQFNVTDAATADYKVKAFVVSHFTNDYLNVGLNLATPVTQTEFDLMLNEQSYNGGQP